MYILYMHPYVRGHTVHTCIMYYILCIRTVLVVLYLSNSGTPHGISQGSCPGGGDPGGDPQHLGSQDLEEPMIWWNPWNGTIPTNHDIL